MDTKDQRALEALLALAFRQELTDKEAVRLFNEPVSLSLEDQKICDSIDIERIINGYHRRNTISGSNADSHHAQ